MSRHKDWSWPGEAFWRGALVNEAQLPDGYTPPSASVNPDATVTPWPRDDSLEALTNAPPAAQIERVGRWRYSIIITRGITQIGPDGGWWHRYGRARAEAKARRELARYKARQERETWTIT